MKILAYTLLLSGLVSCAEDPTPARGGPRSALQQDDSDESGKITEVVDTETLDSMADVMNKCKADGKLYEFSEEPNSPGACGETALLDMDCTLEGIMAASDVMQVQKDLLKNVLDENWPEGTSEELIDSLKGAGEQEIYACTGSFALLNIHTYKMDKESGLVEHKTINLHLQEKEETEN